MTTLGQLHSILQAWKNGISSPAEVPVCRIVLDVSDSDAPVTSLYESQADGLRDLLRIDSTARYGIRYGDDAADEDHLAIAALRMRTLLQSDRLRSTDGDVDRRDLVRFIAATRRLLHNAGQVLTDTSEWRGSRAKGVLRQYVAEELTTDPKYADAVRETAQSLQRCTARLAELERHLLVKTPAIHPLRHAHGDALTMLANLCFTCIPGSYSATFHVRVFQPSSGQRVIVLGDLTDNSSKGIETSAAKVIAQLTDYRADLTGDDPVWVHYLPADYSRYCRRLQADDFIAGRRHGEAEQASLIVIDRQTARFVKITFDEVETLIDGRLKAWHGRDYRTPVMLAMGAELADPVADESRKHLSGAPLHDSTDVVVARCARWFCRTAFRFRVGDVAAALCPRCGTDRMQVLGISR